jgi:hypothetical protein
MTKWEALAWIVLILCLTGYCTAQQHYVVEKAKLTQCPRSSETPSE